MTANLDPPDWRQPNSLAEDFPVLGNLQLAAMHAEDAYLATLSIHAAAKDAYFLATDRNADAATRTTYEAARSSLKVATRVAIAAESALDAALATYENVARALAGFEGGTAKVERYSIVTTSD